MYKGDDGIKFGDQISLRSTQNSFFLEACWFGDKYFPIVIEASDGVAGKLPKHFERCVFSIESAEEEGGMGNSVYVVYGQFVRLLNVDSQRVLRAQRTEAGGHCVVLGERSSSRQLQQCEIFKLVPRYKVREEGEKVRKNDQLLIINASSGMYLRCSEECVEDVLPKTCDSDSKKLKHAVDFSTMQVPHSENEVRNAMFRSRGMVWSIGIYYSEKEERSAEAIRTGNAVMVFHKCDEGFLTVDSEVQDIDHVCEKTTPLVYFDKKKPHKATYNVEELEYSSNALWLIEHEMSQRGGVIEWKQRGRFFRLKHLATGKYLSIEPQGNSLTLSKQKGQDSLISLHPLDDISDNDFDHECLSNHSYARIQFAGKKVWLHAKSEFHPPSKHAAPSASRPYWYRQQAAVTPKARYEDVFAIRRCGENEKQNLGVVVSMGKCLKRFIQYWKSDIPKLLDGSLKSRNSSRPCASVFGVADSVASDGRGVRFGGVASLPGTVSSSVRDASTLSGRSQDIMKCLSADQQFYHSRLIPHTLAVLKTLILYCTMHITQASRTSYASPIDRRQNSSTRPRSGTRRRAATILPGGKMDLNSSLRRGSVLEPATRTAPAGGGVVVPPPHGMAALLLSGGGRPDDSDTMVDPFATSTPPLRQHQMMLFDQGIQLFLFALLRAPLDAGLQLKGLSEDFPELADIYRLGYRLLEQMVVGSKDLAVQFRRYIPFIECQLGFKLRVVGSLVQICKDNIVILNGINESQIKRFIKLIIDCGKDQRYLELLSTLCVCDGTGFKKNQNVIGKHLQEMDKEHGIILPTKTSHGVLYVNPDAQNGDFVPLSEFAANHPQELTLYYAKQIVLFSNLCHGGNAEMKRYVKGLLSKRALLVGMQNSFAHNLCDTIRAAFVKLAVNLYVLKHSPNDLNLMFTDTGVKVRYWFKWAKWLKLAKRGNITTPHVKFLYQQSQANSTSPTSRKQTSQFVVQPATNQGTFSDSQSSNSLDSEERLHVQDVRDVDDTEFIKELKSIAFTLIRSNTKQLTGIHQRNTLITEVLRLVHHFIQMDHYDEDELHKLVPYLLELLNPDTDEVTHPNASAHRVADTWRSVRKKSRRVADEVYTEVDPRYMYNESNAIVMSTKLEACRIVMTLFERDTTLEHDKVNMSQYHRNPHLVTILFELLNYRNNIQLFSTCLFALFCVLSKERGENVLQDPVAVRDFAVILKQDIDRKSFVRTRNVIRYFRESTVEDRVTVALLKVFTTMIHLNTGGAMRAMQCKLDLLGITPLMSLLIESKQEVVVYHALHFGIALLEGGNRQVQDGLVEYFQSLTDEAFFVSIRNRIKKAADQIRERELLEKSKDSASVDTVVTNEGMFHVKETLRLIQLFCEGHNLVLQNYLREQEDNIHTVDLVKETMVFLKKALGVTNVDPTLMDTILQAFNSLTEYCQGPCLANQHRCLAVASEVNTVFKNDFPLCSDEIVSELRGAAINTLLSLLEGCVEPTIPNMLREHLKIDAMRAAVDKVRVNGDEKAVELGFKFYILVATLQSFDQSGTLQGILESDSYAEFRRMTGRIEISRNGILERIYFRIPEICTHLTREARKNLIYSVNRDTPSARIADFFDRLDDIIYEIEYYHDYFKAPKDTFLNVLRHHPADAGDHIKVFIYKRKSFWEYGTTVVGFLSNICVLFFYVNSITKGDSAIEVITTLISSVVIYGFSFAQVVFTGFSLYIYFVTDAAILLHKATKTRAARKKPHIDNEKTGIELRRAKIVAINSVERAPPSIVIMGEECDDGDSPRKRNSGKRSRISTRKEKGHDVCSSPTAGSEEHFNPEHDSDDEGEKEEAVISADVPQRKKMRSGLKQILFTTNAVFLLSMFLASTLSLLYSPFFLSIHLISFVKNSPILQNVIHSITKNSRSLLLTAILGVIIIYLFAVVGFLMFQDSFVNEALEGDSHCETLFRCFVFAIVHGVRTGGGIGELMTPPKWGGQYNSLRMVFDFAYFVVVIVICLNIIFGIIIDTFAELRSERQKVEEDIRTTCFICSIASTEFDRHAQGFEHHVKHDHNMWMYLFFIHHLKRKLESEYTGQESYVSEMVKTSDLSFFPLNKAMRLDQKKETGTLMKSEYDSRQMMGEMERMFDEQIIEFQIELDKSIKGLESCILDLGAKVRDRPGDSYDIRRGRKHEVFDSFARNDSVYQDYPTEASSLKVRREYYQSSQDSKSQERERDDRRAQSDVRFEGYDDAEEEDGSRLRFRRPSMKNRTHSSDEEEVPKGPNRGVSFKVDGRIVKPKHTDRDKTLEYATLATVSDSSATRERALPSAVFDQFGGQHIITRADRMKGKDVRRTPDEESSSSEEEKAQINLRSRADSGFHVGLHMPPPTPIAKAGEMLSEPHFRLPGTKNKAPPSPLKGVRSTPSPALKPPAAILAMVRTPSPLQAESHPRGTPSDPPSERSYRLTADLLQEVIAKGPPQPATRTLESWLDSGRDAELEALGDAIEPGTDKVQPLPNLYPAPVRPADVPVIRPIHADPLPQPAPDIQSGQGMVHSPRGIVVGTLNLSTGVTIQTAKKSE